MAGTFCRCTTTRVFALSNPQLQKCNAFGNQFRSTHGKTRPRWPRHKATRNYSRLSDEHTPGCRGLINLGNSCYQNAVLQCLNSVPEFVQYVREEKAWKAGSSVGPSLTELFHLLWSEDNREPVSARSVTRAVLDASHQFVGGAQEDAHEFLVTLLDALRGEGSRRSVPPSYRELPDGEDISKMAADHWEYSMEWNDSPIDDIFGLQLLNQTACPSCGHISHRFDYATELQLDLGPVKGGVDLGSCLEGFSEPETIQGYVCSSCGSEVSAVKQTSIYRLPKNLIVVLKRFMTVWDGFQCTASKISAPLILESDVVDVSALQSPAQNSSAKFPKMFDLAAIANHSGTMVFGHYTAGVRSISDGRFRNFNDAYVTEIESGIEAQCQDAYLLVLHSRG